MIPTFCFLAVSCEQLFFHQILQGEHDLDLEVLTAALLGCEIWPGWKTSGTQLFNASILSIIGLENRPGGRLDVEQLVWA